MIRILLAAALLGFLAAPSLAQAAKADCAYAATQAQMNNCAAAQYKTTDATLNQSYKQAMSQAKNKDALKQAQRAWITYRDRHCDAVGAQAEGGSMQPLLITSCRTLLTTARITELENLVKPPEN